MTLLNMPKSRDVVFVGNNRRNGRRKLIDDLLSIRGKIDCNVEIWGNGWDGIVPPEWLRGRYFPNEELNALYSSARIVLNDHHDDMARDGFLNPRIVDAIAAGALPITDPVAGLEEAGNIPVYRNAEELADLIGRYLSNGNAARAIIEQARSNIAGWTYEGAAELISQFFQSRVVYN
jgi:spore maturation protein CgeB